MENLTTLKEIFQKRLTSNICSVIIQTVTETQRTVNRMQYRKYNARRYVYRSRRMSSLWRLMCVLLVLCAVALTLTLVSRSGHVANIQSIERTAPLRIPAYI